MNKKEVIKKINASGLDKTKIIILSGASLVLQGVVEKCHDIDLSCEKNYYDSLNWKEERNKLGNYIKTNDVFEIGPNLFDIKNTKVVEGYHVANLESCLKFKKYMNREKNQEVIKRLEKILGDKRC